MLVVNYHCCYKYEKSVLGLRKKFFDDKRGRRGCDKAKGRKKERERDTLGFLKQYQLLVESHS